MAKAPKAPKSPRKGKAAPESAPTSAELPLFAAAPAGFESAAAPVESASMEVAPAEATLTEPASMEAAPMEAAPMEAVVAAPEPVAVDAAPVEPAIEANPAPEPEPRVELKAEAKGGPKVEVKVESKPAPKAEAAPEPKAEAATRSDPNEVMEDRHWHKGGWSAKVIKNEGDDGWAVEICRDGVPEPILISPWTMGRDKKNPKPFDTQAFMTFVKTASEFQRRSERQLEQQLKKSLHTAWDGNWYKIQLEIVPDDYEPSATLTASNDAGETLATMKVPPSYKLTQDNAEKWVRGGFRAQSNSYG